MSESQFHIGCKNNLAPIARIILGDTNGCKVHQSPLFRRPESSSTLPDDPLNSIFYFFHLFYLLLLSLLCAVLGHP